MADPIWSQVDTRSVADATGNFATAMPRYVRSGGAWVATGERWVDAVAGGGTTPPPVGARAHLVGVYDGGGGQDTTRSYFGSYPQIAAWYFNYNQPTLNLTGIRTQINLGISPCITWDTKVNQVDGWATGDPQAAATNNYHHQIAIRSGAGYTAYQSFLTTLTQINTTAKAAGVIVYATIDHEAENNYHKGRFLPSQTSADWAGCLSNFYSDVRDAGLTNIRTTLWTGYFNYTRANDEFQINRMAAQLTSWPDIFTMDPYQETGTQSLETLLTKYIAQVKAMSWWQAHPVPFGCTETGSSGVTDAQYAAFLKNQHALAVKLDLEMIIFFNRTANGQAQTITPATWPLASAAERDSLAGA